MLKVIGTVSVITNATMIAFVGSQLAADGEQIVHLQEVLGITERVNSAKLVWYAVAIEHGIMLLRVVFDTLAPTSPDWVC
eukprot:SAG31_NODE_3685_length_3989_cov_1.633419_4_plen_80_part_00